MTHKHNESWHKILAVSCVSFPALGEISLRLDAEISGEQFSD